MNLNVFVVIKITYLHSTFLQKKDTEKNIT